MSILQTFRDGPSYERETRRQFWRSMGDLIISLNTLACVLTTLVFASHDHYDKATFFGVLALWGMCVRRGSVNG